MTFRLTQMLRRNRQTPKKVTTLFCGQRVRVGVCTSVGIVAQKNRYICIFDTLRLESQSGQMISSGTPIIASIYQTQLTTYRVYRLSSQPDRGAETSLIWIVARPTC